MSVFMAQIIGLTITIVMFLVLVLIVNRWASRQREKDIYKAIDRMYQYWDERIAGATTPEEYQRLLDARDDCASNFYKSLFK